MRYSQISERFTTVVFLEEVAFLQHLQNKRGDLVVQQAAHSPQVFIWSSAGRRSFFLLGWVYF